MQKFLVIQTAFIGDVVLATAIAEKLHEYYPDGQIDFLVRKGNESLFDRHPFVKKVWVWDKKRYKIFNLLKITQKIRSESYDEVINLQRFFSSGFLTFFSGAKKTRGYLNNPFASFFTLAKPHKISTSGNMHEVERNQQLIVDITDDRYAKPKLYPSFKEIKKIDLFVKKPYICCAPGSVWFTKQYPKENWIDFLEKITQEINIYFVGAQEDSNLVDQIIEKSRNKRAENWCGKLTYLESAALISGANMNFSNDSAPLHFASAVNAPIAALFCSTTPEFGFGPLSDKRIILETEENLSCRPCGVHGLKKCPKEHFKCGYTILPKKLIEVINER